MLMGGWLNRLVKGESDSRLFDDFCYTYFSFIPHYSRATLGNDLLLRRKVVHMSLRSNDTGLGASGLLCGVICMQRTSVLTRACQSLL